VRGREVERRGEFGNLVMLDLGSCIVVYCLPARLLAVSFEA